MARKAKKKLFEFALGERVRDNATGFEGIVTSRTQHLGRSNTYGVQLGAEPGKLLPLAEILDEGRLALVSEGGA